MFLVLFLIIFSACISSETDLDTELESDSDIELNTETETDTFYEGKSKPPYTESVLESDPRAPSINPEDYNIDGEYVPEDGLFDNPADYNSDGEYKPVDEMTQDEIEAELEEMLGR